MVPEVIKSKVVFDTPWFKLLAKSIMGMSDNCKIEEYYCVQPDDYVSILAVTNDSKIILVRQFRATLENYSLELPAGHIDKDESPEAAIKRELLEETGYLAHDVELLGCLNTDTGRLSNRHWCFFTSNAVLDQNLQKSGEAGIDVHLLTKAQFCDAILNSEFKHGLHLSVVLLAILRKKLTL